MCTATSPASRSRPPPASERDRPVRAQALTTGGALAALQPEWERLWSAAAGATPFQSPRWLLPWWRHVGAGELAAVAVRCAVSGELVGLAPLYRYTDPANARRHLFPIGIATTDYLDLLVRAGWEDAVLACLARQLAADAARWQVFECPQLRPQSPLLELPLPPGWQRELAAGEPNPALQLQPGAGPRLPPQMAQNLRTARSRAARLGTLACEWAQPATIDVLLEELARLHGARWTGRGSAGVLAAPGVLAMHREAAPLLHAAGLLRLAALRLDGDCIAVLYALADPPGRERRRWYYYLAGFEPRLAAISPGALLLAEAVAQASAEGAAAFDFLRGAESYKYRWGAVDQPMCVLRIRPGEAGTADAGSAP